MRFLVLILFLFFQSAFAQKPVIDLKIDSITSSDSLPDERKYIVRYHIENLTDKKIAFLLNTDNNDSIHGVNTNRMSYNLYQDTILLKDFYFSKSYDYATFIEFFKALKKAKTSEEENVIINNPEFKKFKIHPVYLEKITEKKEPDHKKLQRFENETIYNTLKTIEPKETRHFELVLYWNKNRYFRDDVNEFYLEENSNCFIEFTFSTQDFDYMYFNATEGLPHDESAFFKSTNVSNKVPIRFYE